MAQLKVARSKTAALFKTNETAPGIGGLVLATPQSRYSLTPEVVLFEPSPGDIHRGGQPQADPSRKPGTRLIFLNTPLTDWEQQQLRQFHEALEKEAEITNIGEGKFPDYVRLHILRILQQCKWNLDKAFSVVSTHLELRVRNLPIQEAAVLEDLQSCMMYWHGRDRSCRPVLVWRMQEIANMDLDRATRMILFILEYGVRYLMVPGRVENWVLIVDLTNCGVSMASQSSCRNIARNVTRMLEEVYCGRNFTTKIFHMPWLLRSIVNSLIPADKKSKVEFVADGDIPKVMQGVCEPHQLEQQYGGTAPNVKQGAVDGCYPFRFFPHCRSPSSGGSPAGESLHAHTERVFHEGHLWDQHAAEKVLWEASAPKQSLSTASAKALSTLLGQTVDSTVTMDAWFEKVDPAEAERRKPKENGSGEEPAKAAVAPPEVPLEATPEAVPEATPEEAPVPPIHEVEAKDIDNEEKQPDSGNTSFCLEPLKDVLDEPDAPVGISIGAIPPKMEDAPQKTAVCFSWPCSA